MQEREASGLAATVETAEAVSAEFGDVWGGAEVDRGTPESSHKRLRDNRRRDGVAINFREDVSPQLTGRLQGAMKSYDHYVFPKPPFPIRLMFDVRPTTPAGSSEDVEPALPYPVARR